MLVCLRARRQRMELLAKAIIASAVRLRVRAVVTWHKQSVVKRIHLAYRNEIQTYQLCRSLTIRRRLTFHLRVKC